MESKFFFAVLGGTPRYAHLFFKHKLGYFGYLDPHQTKKSAQTIEDLLSQMDSFMGKL